MKGDDNKLVLLNYGVAGLVSIAGLSTAVIQKRPAERPTVKEALKFIRCCWTCEGWTHQIPSPVKTIQAGQAIYIYIYIFCRCIETLLTFKAKKLVIHCWWKKEV